MVNSLHSVYFFMLLIPSADFFKIIFFKKSFRTIIKISNVLDLDQDRHSVNVLAKVISR